METISKPSKIFSQLFGTKVWQRFFKTQPWKQRFSKFFKDATFENEGFQRFSEGRKLRVEGWFVNDGSPTSISPPQEGAGLANLCGAVRELIHSCGDELGWCFTEDQVKLYQFGVIKQLVANDSVISSSMTGTDHRPPPWTEAILVVLKHKPWFVNFQKKIKSDISEIHS